MKPTVINNSENFSANNNAANSQPYQQQQPQQNASDQQQIPKNSAQNHPGYQNTTTGSPRRFPFPEFDFYDDDDGIFSNTGLRSRMNRMRDPFSTWGRKRRGSNQAEPTADIEQDDDFFPTFQPPWMNTAGSQWNRAAPRKRPQHPTEAAAPTGPPEEEDDEFFSYIPQEFRQYIPSRFQFPSMRSQFGRQPTNASSPTEPASGMFYEQPPNLQQQKQQEIPITTPQTKPKYCDAAMQTDSSNSGPENEHNQPAQSLNQHGLRNTVPNLAPSVSAEGDDRIPRSHSAPPQPPQPQDNNSSSSSSHSNANHGPNGQPPQAQAFAQATPGAQASATAFANCGTNTTPNNDNPNFFRQYYYPFDGRQQRPGQPQGASEPTAAPTSPQRHEQFTQQQPENTEGSFIRQIPIVIESRKVPPKPKPQESQSSQQNQAPAANERAVPIQVTHTSNQQPPQGSQQQQQPEQEEQTAATSPKNDSISKIQVIQADVMNLMIAVERFKGTRKDKEYIWLDEMLTRNLLKLDDIETEGKENIRLARKEAIKCIQASLCVLEMKADGVIPEETNPSSSCTQEEQKEGNAEETPKEVERTVENPIPIEEPKIEENVVGKTAENSESQTKDVENANVEQSIAEPVPKEAIDSLASKDSKVENASSGTQETEEKPNTTNKDTPKTKKIAKKVVKKDGTSEAEVPVGEAVAVEVKTAQPEESPAQAPEIEESAKHEEATESK